MAVFGMEFAFRNLGNRLAGVVVCCDDSTVNSHLDGHVFESPVAQCRSVDNVVAGTAVFLLNCTRMELHGVFVATTKGELITSGRNGESDCAHIPVKVHKEATPLKEPEFKRVIRDDSRSGRCFQLELDQHQAKQLCGLFKSSVPQIRGQGRRSVLDPPQTRQTNGEGQPNNAQMDISREGVGLETENSEGDRAFWDEKFLGDYGNTGGNMSAELADVPSYGRKSRRRRKRSSNARVSATPLFPRFQASLVEFSQHNRRVAVASGIC